MPQNIITNLWQPGTTGMFARLAWQCMSTFRSSDYLGGCNGARILLEPQNDWSVNKGLDFAIDQLKLWRKNHFSDSISMADLIVLAGNLEIEELGGNKMEFCGGRTDDASSNHDASRFLESNQISSILGKANEGEHLRSFIDLMGLTLEEYAAIHGAGFAIGHKGYKDPEKECGGLFCLRNPSHTGDRQLSNIFFKEITNPTHLWTKDTDRVDGKCHKAIDDPNLCMYSVDFQFKFDPELNAIAEKYAANNELFKANFASAWVKLASADMFYGPVQNRCDKEEIPTTTTTTIKSKSPKPTEIPPGNCTCPEQEACESGGSNMREFQIVWHITIFAIAVIYFN